MIQAITPFEIALERARKRNKNVWFEHNRISTYARPFDTHEEVAERWRLIRQQLSEGDHYETYMPYV